MGAEETPIAGDAPNLEAGTDILREMLAIERERLKVARQIEERRGMVFPETSVIVRDIERLLGEIERRGSVPPVPRDNKAVAEALEQIGATCLR